MLNKIILKNFVYQLSIGTKIGDLE